MQHIREIAERVCADWVANAVAIRPGATEAELARFEAEHQLCLPDEFRTYLAVVNGMTDWETDEQLIEFMSLDRIAQEVRESGERPVKLVPVAQYSIFARVYALRMTPQRSATSPVYTIGEYTDVPLFPSFTELLEAYLEDPAALLR